MLAIVLSRHDFRENDQIVSLYTQEKGKMEVLARGVKKIISKNSAYLEPGFLVDAEIVSGKEITHLTKVQPINLFKNIRTDLAKISMVGYAMNTLDRLLKPGDADKRIFQLTASFLEFLDETSEVPPLLLDAFLLKIFSLLGFDVTSSENIDLGIKKYLDTLLKNSWGNLPSGLDKRVAQALHKTVHNFMQIHSEQKLAYFSQI